MKAHEYDSVTYPRSRLSTIDLGRLAARTHIMYSLLEIDVTDARQSLRRHRREGRDVSFSAWMIKSIGDCVAENLAAHALQSGARRLILFHDVDIAFVVERLVDGVGVPLPLLITSTNTKSAVAIQAEIRAATERRIGSERDYILSDHRFSTLALRLYYALPSILRVFALRRIVGNPFRMKRHAGTVMVTTVNAVGTSPAWILPTRSMHNLSFALGSVTSKPWVVDGTVKVREVLNLTVAFNHDAIDGVPAKRFIQELVKRLESGGGKKEGRS
jgi:hypothetical protein